MYIKWKLLVNTVNTCTFKPTYSHCKWFAFSPLIVKLNCKKQCRVTLSTGWCFCLCQGRLEPAGRHEQWESHGSIRGRDEESSTGGTWHFYRTHIFKFNVLLILSTQYRWKYDILINVLTNHFDVKRITFWAARSLALQSNRFTVTLWSSTFQKINEFLSSMLPGQMNTGVCNEPSSDEIKVSTDSAGHRHHAHEWEDGHALPPLWASVPGDWWHAAASRVTAHNQRRSAALRVAS